MNANHLLARDVLAGATVDLEWQDGVITARHIVAGDAEWRVVPPLFDVQVNGFAGVDFQRDGLGEARLARAVRGLRAEGCTRFLLTLITDDWSRLTERLRRVKQVRDASGELRSAIAGWHLEGPFLSSEEGFHGAHDPGLMIDPRPDHFHTVREIAGNDPVLVTLAPERPGSLEAIAVARRLHMTVSLGHTNAPAALLSDAVAAGASGFTHLGNGCPQRLDRHDNVLWRAVETSGLRVSLIPDGLHVSPPLFRILHRLLAPGSILYTTDAMAAAGAPAGRYTLGRLELEVGVEGVVRQPGRTNFAGSALGPREAVRRAAGMLRQPWWKAWEALSTSPADWLGLPRALGPGAPADFCLVREDGRGGISDLRVFVNGQEATQPSQDNLGRQ